MKKFTWICVILSALLISGCSSTYERDDNPGKVEKITVAEMQKKIDDKDTFAVVFTQTSCVHCQKFMAMLDTYLLNHNVTLYDVVLDQDPNKDWEGNLEIIRTTFPGMDETPSLFYVKDGVKDNQLENGEEGLTEEAFDQWVQDNKLDAKK